MHSHYDLFSSAVVVSRRRGGRKVFANDLENVTELKSYNIEVAPGRIKVNRILCRLHVKFIRMTMPEETNNNLRFSL